MNRTLAIPSSRNPLENVQKHMAKVQTDPKAVVETSVTVEDIAILSLVDTARRRAGLKLEYLAFEAGVKISTLSAAISGHGSFNILWLWRWPSSFWNEFLPLLRAHKEESDDAKRAQRKERLLHAIDLLLTEVA